jgi:hypothetical protein
MGSGGSGGGNSAPQGGYTGANTGNGFIPPNLTQAANSYLSNANSINSQAQSWANGTAPYLAAVGGMISNPYATQTQQGVGQVANGMATQGMNLYNTANNTGAYIPGLMSAANATMNTAFDPQNALYNRTLGQVTQQNNAGQAARGLAMSPVGAELSNQANSNFNIDWQNAQLGRQTQGLSAYGNAAGQASNLGKTQAALAQTGGALQQQGAMMPYNFYQGNTSAYQGNLTAAQQAQNNQINMQLAPNNQYATYMGYGAAGANPALSSAATNYNQQQAVYGPMMGAAQSLMGAAGTAAQNYIWNSNGTSDPTYNAGVSTYAPTNSVTAPNWYQPSYSTGGF